MKADLLMSLKEFRPRGIPRGWNREGWIAPAVRALEAVGGTAVRYCALGVDLRDGWVCDWRRRRIQRLLLSGKNSRKAA
jgi:hypothetical protein